MPPLDYKTKQLKVNSKQSEALESAGVLLKKKKFVITKR